MSGNIQPEVWPIVQISLKRDRLFLMSPQADQPLNQQRTRQELDCNFCVVKPMSGKAQVRLQATATEPVAVNHTAASRAGSLYPAQHQDALPAIVAGEEQEPQDINGGRAQSRDDDQTHHKTLRCEWYDLGCKRARPSL